MSEEIVDLLRSIPHATKHGEIVSTLDKLKEKKHALSQRVGSVNDESELRLANTQLSALDSGIDTLQKRLAFMDANKERQTVEAKPQRSDFETRAGSAISDSMGIDVSEHKGDPQDFLEVEAKQFALENMDSEPGDFAEMAKYYAQQNAPHFASKEEEGELAKDFFNKTCAEHSELRSIG